MARFGFINNSPALVQWLALLMSLVGVVTWAVLLSSSSAAPTQAAVQTTDGTTPQGAQAAHWFSSAANSLEIKLTGLLATQQGAVAILSIDDQPARAFLAGEQLGEGVSLRGIEADAVVIDRSGTESRLNMTRLPEAAAMPALR